MPILILGGTGEARELAAALHRDNVAAISSLAGRVARPRLPVGEVRIGGFGGPEKLAEWLGEERIDAIVDATHPFAERISASAAQASARVGVPLLRLERSGWSARDGDRWSWADDLDGAAALIPPGARVLLTTGRQGLPAFASVEDAFFLVRCVDPPDPPLPSHHELLLDRGPYTLAGELELIDAHRLDLVVTKDSGGALTEAKLDAARERGLPVIVVRRPARVAGSAVVASVDEAVAWVRARLAHPG
ncbi:cobalt-precorrin-6A reductase [Conexibacter sp. CPCC 206217]|uniref:cobalt-precorrin-6A reductase n=1 Tax=Conexibacter sp. CPCC 206217 TaxID=3064574 RepID=UPI002724D9EA|nr:cobalt-precorrin-6A reductase [Conexibacter sp. CPCC 206217]MDO8213625.1 cobalt-precorrin-6A reductase [Conexibacter sp. CPCC 206217]